MTPVIGLLPLREVATGKAVQASIHDGIAPEHVADWATKWRPVIAATGARLKAKNAPITDYPQSMGWDWDKKASVFSSLLTYRTFAVIAAGDTQGMMAVELATHRSLLPDDRGLPGQGLVYVEFLEAAPWNRPEHVRPPKYRGVGRALVTVAIQLSLDEGFKGRIGLHSLPQSEEFYRDKVKMHDFGPDPNYSHQLRYFELNRSGAETFIKGGVP